MYTSNLLLLSARVPPPPFFRGIWKGGPRQLNTKITSENDKKRKTLHQLSTCSTFVLCVSPSHPPYSRILLQWALSQFEGILVSLEKSWRAACFSHPPRTALEMQAYGRDHFLRSSSGLLSVPMICFVDGFGLYRNMYRTVIGVYLTILASMNIRHRTRQAT